MTRPASPRVEGQAASLKYGRDRRLRRAAEFSAVYNRGRAWSGPRIVVKILHSRSHTVRFGFAVGKKLGGAVIRNRVKRRLRDIVRQLPVVHGWDVVVIAKAPAVAATYEQLRGEVQDLFRRARLLQPPAAQRPVPVPQES